MDSSLSWELPPPQHFEAIADLVTEDAVAESVVCGPVADEHVKAIDVLPRLVHARRVA